MNQTISALPARSIIDLETAVIAIDATGTVQALSVGAAWLLRCSIEQYKGESAARFLPALNHGLNALAIPGRRGIALRADGKVIQVSTTGIPYRSKQSAGWMILVERSSVERRLPFRDVASSIR